MTALLFPDEASRLVPGERLVIVRVGEHPDWCSGNRNWSECECWGTDPVAPQAWVALTGPCPRDTDGDGNCAVCFKRERPPDCRDGRRIVPLYTECPPCHNGDPMHPLPTCMTGRVLVGRGSITVVPVVGDDYGAIGYVWPSFDCIFVDTSEPDDHHTFLYTVADEMTMSLRLDPLPVPRRDWGIVIDCVEVAGGS